MEKIKSFTEFIISEFLMGLVSLIVFVLWCFNMPILVAHFILTQVLEFNYTIKNPTKIKQCILFTVCSIFSICFYYTTIQLFK